MLARFPLFRLLLINLAIGIAAAFLLFGGLLLLNPHRLRDLIFSDTTPGTALALLLFGFVVTFGSVAMGSAIMTIGRDNGTNGGGRRVGRSRLAFRPKPARAPAPVPGRIAKRPDLA